MSAQKKPIMTTIPQFSQKSKLMNNPDEALFDDGFQTNYGPPETGIDAQFPMNNQGVRARSPRRSKSPPRAMVK
jgi:hypothetical protein